MATRLVIILPCFNPPAGWDRNMVQNIRALREYFPQVEISPVIINDGSRRGIHAGMIQSLQEELSDVDYLAHESNKGKGAALRSGLFNSSGDLFIYTDIDFPYTIRSCKEIIEKLLQNNDVVLGYRETHYYKKVPFSRKIISRMLRWILKNILRLKITDTQCGLKGFNNKGKDIFLDTRINRFLFDMEFVMYCSRDKNVKMETVNVQLNDNVKFSRMNYRILFTESFNFLMIIFRRRK